MENKWNKCSERRKPILIVILITLVFIIIDLFFNQNNEFRIILIICLIILPMLILIHDIIKYKNSIYLRYPLSPNTISSLLKKSIKNNGYQLNNISEKIILFRKENNNLRSIYELDNGITIHIEPHLPNNSEIYIRGTNKENMHIVNKLIFPLNDIKRQK